MKDERWHHDLDPARQLRELAELGSRLGFLVVEFASGGSGDAVRWRDLEAWTRSRAVTVADVSGTLASPGLEVALCCDLVYLRSGTRLQLSGASPTPHPGVVWALGRRGRGALARGLLDLRDLGAAEAVALGLAETVVDSGAPLPLPVDPSFAALTSARDLVRARARGSAGMALELATFRLLFASGDPVEGARAFLEKREPKFDR
jgi:enoyl-CoA hydratase/carnithine racemase